MAINAEVVGRYMHLTDGNVDVSYAIDTLFEINYKDVDETMGSVTIVRPSFSDGSLHETTVTSTKEDAHGFMASMVAWLRSPNVNPGSYYQDFTYPPPPPEE